MAGEWIDQTLGGLLTLQRGFDLPQADRRPGIVPVIASTGQVGTHSAPAVNGPGVVIGRSGSLGGGQFIRTDYWPLNTTLWVKDFKGNDVRFCYYLLKSLDLASFNAGSGVPTLNRNHIHPLPIRVPTDVVEQLAIAHILGTLDDKIELNRRMNETLEAIVRALFQSWFVDFDPVHAKAEGRDPGLPKPIASLFPDSFDRSCLGRIPTGWLVGSVLDIAHLESGGTPKTDRSEYWGGPHPWASARDVSQCGDAFLLETDRSVTAQGIRESATQVIAAFSTVVVARGATTGRMVLLGRAMAMNQTCYALVTKTTTPFALYCQLRREMENLVHAAHGSVFDTVTTSTFAASKVIVPPQILLGAFEERVGPAFRRILAGTEASRTLAALRDTLLPRLIAGELRVQDAERIVGNVV
jgi:type I restriction enzyme S subunit